MNGNMRFLFGILVIIFLMSVPFDGISGEGDMSANEPKVVDHVDVARYVGKWYSIAEIPQIFTKPCAGGTTATYSLRKDGTIDVVNACYKKDGSLYSVKGRAWAVDAKTNAKLKVSFFLSSLKINALSGDYWILDLGKDYEYSVVGEPTRKYGWILSRTRELPQDVLDPIIERLEANGYKFSDFVMINHKDYGVE